MKKQELIDLHASLDGIAVLQHFIDSEAGSLFIGMDGVENRVGVKRELDMKIRILLGVQISQMEKTLTDAGIDLTAQDPEASGAASGAPPNAATEKVIDATASEADGEVEGTTTAEESPRADEENSSE